MLVLTRKLQEQLRIGNDVTVTVLRVKGNTVRLGIEAPKEVSILRGELPRFDDSPAGGEEETGMREVAEDPAAEPGQPRSREVDAQYECGERGERGRSSESTRHIHQELSSQGRSLAARVEARLAELQRDQDCDNTMVTMEIVHQPEQV